MGLAALFCLAGMVVTALSARGLRAPDWADEGADGPAPGASRYLALVSLLVGFGAIACVATEAQWEELLRDDPVRLSAFHRYELWLGGIALGLVWHLFVLGRWFQRF